MFNSIIVLLLFTLGNKAVKGVLFNKSEALDFFLTSHTNFYLTISATNTAVLYLFVPFTLS